MDHKDRQILDLLQEDARSTQADIGRKVGLSASSVNDRIRNLEKSGALRRWTVLVDDQAVGANITAFIEVFIDSPLHEKAFTSLVETLPEVLECHFVTGDFTCLLKVKVPSRQALRRIIFDRVNSLHGVRQTRTYIVLDTVREDPRVPVDGLSEEPGEPGFIDSIGLKGEDE